jgi:hypothetical protein
MERRSKRTFARALVGACMLLAGTAAQAQATFVYTDIPDFNLTGSWSAYGGGTQYHISSTGDGTVSYRWIDVTPQDNIISGNSCSDLSSFGSHYYSAGVTVYRQLFSGFSGLCFLLLGETAGGGSMYLYDGRLQR